MEKRKIKFGTYDTALNGWTLSAWEITMPEYKSNFVEVPGRDGDLDMSTALTDGVPRYGNRTLTATLECSDGSRMDRESLINTMVNWLDGWRMDIVLPDDPDHFLTGRVSVRPEYNDPAHASVTVMAICDPWRYRNYETVVSLIATEAQQTGRLTNSGRRMVVPLVEIISGAGFTLRGKWSQTEIYFKNDVVTYEGSTWVMAAEGSYIGSIPGIDIEWEEFVEVEASVNLTFGAASWELGAGTYQLPDLVVPQGGVDIEYSGTGGLKFSYREAVL